MARSKRPRQRRRPEPAHSVSSVADPLTGEDRATEAITVGWMIAVMITLMCTIAWLITWALSQAGEGSVAGRVVLGYLTLTSGFLGIISLVLTPVVLRLRHIPPPLPITIGAVVIGLIPWLFVFLM